MSFDSGGAVQCTTGSKTRPAPATSDIKCFALPNAERPSAAPANSHRCAAYFPFFFWPVKLLPVFWLLHLEWVNWPGQSGDGGESGEGPPKVLLRRAELS